MTTDKEGARTEEVDLEFGQKVIKPMEIDTSFLEDVEVEFEEGWTDSEVTESEYEESWTDSEGTESEYEESSEVTESEYEEDVKKKKRSEFYFCSQKGCGANFSRLDHLVHHKKKHTVEERPFVCLFRGCSKSYTTASHLKRHTQEIHEKDDEVVLKCRKKGCCNKLFKTTTTLNKHIKNFHKKKKYVCRTCFKHFNKNQHLKVHRYEHTGIKPYRCQHKGCDKRFLIPSALKVHMKTHIGHKCNEPDCDAVFSTWTLLVRHRQMIHPLAYKCDICDRSFCSGYNLRSHIKIHDIEREKLYCPYKNCSKYYMHKRNLTVHIESYHKRREFACFYEGCNAIFSHKVSLRRHLEIHEENFPRIQQRPFICLYDDCIMSYTRASHLKRHTRDAHEKDDKVLLEKKKRTATKRRKGKVKKECKVESSVASPKHKTDVDPPKPRIVYLENDDRKDIDSSMTKKELSDGTSTSHVEIENKNDSTNNAQEAGCSMTKCSETDSVETTPLVKVKFLKRKRRKSQR